MKKKRKKKILRRKKIKTKIKINKRYKSTDLQKIMGLKFQKLSKAYKDFKKKREAEKLKQKKLKSETREKQIKNQQVQLKNEEKELKVEEKNRLKEINLVRIERERKTREEQKRGKDLTQFIKKI